MGRRNFRERPLEGRNGVVLATSRRRTGLSILEAAIAMMLLAGAVLSCITMFHLGLRRQTQSANRVIATGVAERNLEQLRQQAGQRSSFRDIGSMDGTYRPDRLQPGFEVAIWPEQTEIQSPCSSLNNASSEDTSRTMEKASAYQVLIVVRWNRRDPAVRICSVVAEPRGVYRELTFPDLPPVLTRDQLATVNPQLLDGDGNPIRGVKFSFWTRPGTATTTLLRPKNGKQVRILNRVNSVSVDGEPVEAYYPGGKCRITATARYFGQTIRAHSPLFELER